MKKYLSGFMLLLITLSSNSFSGNQVCYPTGPNQWTCIEYYTPSNLSAFGPPGSTVNNGMTTNSTTYSTSAYAAKQAAESAAKKAEAEAKKKYCKDNGYTGSFCAELKAEEEAHKKFCSEYPAKIDLAVEKCILDAHTYRGYFVDNHCDNGESSGWSFTGSIQGKGDVSFSTNINSGAFCREDATNAMNTTVLRCNYSGNVVRNAVKQHCSDVQ